MRSCVCVRVCAAPCAHKHAHHRLRARRTASRSVRVCANVCGARMCHRRANSHPQQPLLYMIYILYYNAHYFRQDIEERMRILNNLYAGAVSSANRSAPSPPTHTRPAPPPPTSTPQVRQPLPAPAAPAPAPAPAAFARRGARRPAGPPAPCCLFCAVSSVHAHALPAFVPTRP